MHNKIKDFVKELDIEEFKNSIKVPIYNDFKFSSSYEQENKDLFFYGLSVAMPVINNFIKYTNGFNRSIVDSLVKEHTLRSYLLTNIPDLSMMNGINALNIKLDNQNSSFNWGKDFEVFLDTRELKITYWTNPVEQISLCLLLSLTFDCFFDIDHHMKSLFTILCMNDDILDKHGIKRPIFNENEYNIIGKILPIRHLTDLRSCIEDRTYKGKKKGYTHISRYAKNLPSGCCEYLQKGMDVMSKTTKRDFCNTFKKEKFTNQLMMIAFKKNFIPQVLKDSFAILYRGYDDKKYLINIELNRKYISFERALMVFDYLTPSAPIGMVKPALKKGIFKELLKYEIGQSRIAPLIKVLLGPVPVNKIILPKQESFKGFDVMQIKSARELILKGKAFNNCLQNTQSYRKKLIDPTNLCYFLVFTKNVNTKNYRSFVSFFSIFNRKITIHDMTRKNNDYCSQEERSLLYEFLILKDLIEIPDDFYAHFFMQKMNEFMSCTKINGVRAIKRDAALIFSSLKKLHEAKKFLYPVDDQLISEGISVQVLNKLSEEFNIN